MKYILISFLFLQLAHSKTIVFVGDSLTEGYGVEKKQSYPSLVEEKLKAKGHDIKVVNGGISGSTSASLMARLKWFSRLKPDIVFIAIGNNDGMRGQKVEKIQENISKAIEYSKQQKWETILAEMVLPMNYGKEYRANFEKIFKLVAKKHKVPLMPIFLKGVGGIREMNIEDGIHPNPEGHKVLADKVVKFLEGQL